MKIWSGGRRRVIPRFIGLCLLLATALASACNQRPDAAGPSILVVTLDTTRRDHLGLYGYGRATSPNLDRFATEATVYTRAYSTSSWTLPAHASIFTGKLTAGHGARYDPNGPFRLTDGITGPEVWKELRARGLSAGEQTLAGRLSQAGWRTGGIVAGPWMKKLFGLGTGFADYDDDGIEELNGRLARQVTERAIAWIDRRGSERFFLFLNYYDPHAPYAPPAKFVRALDPTGDGAPPGDRERDVALYDAEIRSMDHELGRVLDHLRARELFRNMWIIVTADHGEFLGEHGKTDHGRGVFEEEIRIPLLVKKPGTRGGTRDDTLVQLTDILPMLLGSLGLEVPGGIHGEDPENARRPIVAEVHSRGSEQRWIRALIEDDFKLVATDKRSKLYDLGSDLGEQQNVMRSDRERGLAMRARLDAYLASIEGAGEAGPDVDIDESTRRALENLGYLE
ncbi:MAG: sulfatase [Myxococcales bacterium]|nr:sulfatase [Myxococcales bacterium]